MATVINQIAVISDALERCKAKGNTEWIEKHSEHLKKLCNHLPSGSGYDSGTKLLSASYEKAIFSTSYHHTNEAGCYTGWTEHVVTIKAAFDGFTIHVSGKDKNGVKEVIQDDFYFALGQEVDNEGNLLDKNYKEFRELAL